MKKTRFTDEQIIDFLKQAEAAMPTKDIYRSAGFSQPTWNSQTLSPMALERRSLY